MKRVIALILAVILFLTSAEGVYATELLQVWGEEEEAVKEDVSSEPSEDVYRVSEQAETLNIGQVEVTVGTAMFFDGEVSFAAALTDRSGNSRSETIVLGGDSAENCARFTGLADGEYTLTVTGAGFTPYVQTINVSQKRYLVKLSVGFLGGYSYVSGGLHPGVLLPGDIDGSGEVDELDKNAMIDAVDSSRAAEGFAADINGDGKIDLVDLQYLAGSYGVSGDRMAAIEEFVSSEAVSAAATSGTTVEGDLNKLLDEGKSVILRPENGQEISGENPVALEFDFANVGMATMMDGIIIGTGSSNPISQAVITITYEEDGTEYTVEVPVSSGVHFLLKESEVYADEDESGIQVHLGAQVAVKKVTITITGAQEGNNLVEITEVEFINGMEERIPDPEMDIPEKLTAVAGSKQFTLTWEPCVNVTGYEVKICLGNQEETILTTVNSLSVTRFGSGELKNYTTYTVSVQSVNGSWRSGYCDPIEVTPKPSGPPDKPDNVSAVGKYKSIAVSWKKMDDTQKYNLFYKIRNTDSSYTKVEGITENSYTITGLEDLTEYEIYVTGINEWGESPESIHCAAKTTDLNPAEMPKYNVINRDENGVPGSAHIKSATRNGGTMVDSALDDGLTNTAWGTVDNNAASYYSKTTWDDGGFNNLGSNGITYEFDQPYEMDTIALLPTDGMNYSYAQVRCWVNETDYYTRSVSIESKTDADGRPYYLLKLPAPMTVCKVQIGLARYLATSAYQLVTISEVYFYHYDTLRDEIMGLYTDDLHTVLREEVTQETIDNLRVKVNAPDEFGEENPQKAALLRELETAEMILNDLYLNNSVEIDNRITTNDTGRGFSGLNAWQPLGVTAAAGETITVYVGHNTKSTGDSTNLQLVSTQYHSESGGLSKVVATLKVGANEITIPKIGSSIGAESGGALYVQYTGNSTTDRYAVRVSGGAQVPILNLYKVTDEAERLEKAAAYVKELEAYTAQMEELHNELHKGTDNSNVNYDYDERNCILGASDIMLDTMMLSLPAGQILAGAGSGSTEQKAQRIVNSMKAIEDMMYLFYQHKGLNASAPAAINQIPKGHLNIRYQRMFSGAFMYASGNHIGIEWNETKGMMSSVSVVSDEEGRYVSGSYFGWGIAHEIGHCINQDKYEIAEITNNYFAQLAQAQDKNAGMRFSYSNIYAKVTSGTTGDCSNIATQLGMYWQLHLAYDKGYNYKTYSDYTEQLSSLFYARMDTYARNAASAPAPDSVALNLSGTKDQLLMRLACAAAEKNILEFFERWGKTPDEVTIAYAEQFPKENRAIYYVSDDSRVYALEGSGSSLKEDGTTEAIEKVTVAVRSDEPNKVDFTFRSMNIPEADVLGYEIIRCTISGGKIEQIPVGFTVGTTFTDTVTTMNNRAVFYEVTLVDQYLNRSAVVTTDAVKIEHDGSMDKSNWSISTTGLTAENTVLDATDEMPCEQTVEDAANMAIDQNTDTVYAPAVESDRAEIVLEFNQTLVVSGLKYTKGDGTSIGDYEVYVCADDEWILVSEGTLNGSKTIYFANEDEAYISTYAATAVKLVLADQKDTKVSIAELDVLAPTGDNVDFRRTGTEKTVIGILEEDYEDLIPAGSLVFVGSYKGNPAYNVVLLYDQDGNIVSGLDEDGNHTAGQIILADVPEEGDIANVSNGTWVYWIAPEAMENMVMPLKVRAELYRVNNALTNEGQRLVSDSLFEIVPETLPGVTLDSGN